MENGVLAVVDLMFIFMQFRIKIGSISSNVIHAL